MPTNGSGARRLPSFIDTFVTETANLGTPEIHRRWAAIATLAGVLEQKVWIQTSQPLYPNLYTFIIGHPGTGKTRVLREARILISALPEPFIAPISMTFASLTDAFDKCRRAIIRQPEGKIEYNSMIILADELGAFMHKYDTEMVKGLSAFYDVTPYTQTRRTDNREVIIPKPQINLITGTTPTDILSLMPEEAWGQGFASRSIFVFSDERISVRVFAKNLASNHEHLLHDLKIINSLYGEFHVTQAYQDALYSWQDAGRPPIPNHPKLVHYIGRREVNIIKLSMISSVNRDNGLALTEADFFQAIEWLIDAESNMTDIFKAGAMNADAAAMDEIVHFISTTDLGTGVSEQRILHFAQRFVPLASVMRVIEIMTGSGLITLRRTDLRTKARFYSVQAPATAQGPAAPTPPSIADLPMHRPPHRSVQ